MRRWVLLTFVASGLGGCGTVTRGTTEQVTFNSEPSGAHVQTSTGFACAVTPCTLEIPRKSEFLTTFTLEGYEPQQIPVITKVSGSGGASFAGNILLGGIVGMAADASTGAAYDHSPNPVFAQLTPTKRATPPRARTTRRQTRARPTAPTQ